MTPRGVGPALAPEFPGNCRWAPEIREREESELPDHENPDMDMFFPDSPPDNSMGDEWSADHGPYDLNDVIPAEVMTDALICAGTDPDAARLFTCAIIQNEFPSSFMEIYGRGEIMKNANGPRRALNVQGLGALDLRTFKPNGETWNFEKRSDRNEARNLIDSLQPTWIIGSPPCTAFFLYGIGI